MENKYFDRKVDGLPQNGDLVFILLPNSYFNGDYNDKGYTEILAKWVVYNPVNYSNEQPAQGYLGTFIDTENMGYHVWDQNDSEIRYWRKLIDTDFDVKISKLIKHE